MKAFKFIVKIIGLFLLLLIPLALFYWLLIMVNLEFTKPIVALLGIIFNPIISAINIFIHYEIVNNGYTINFDPLIAAIIITILFLVFAQIEKLLDYFEKFTQDLDNKSKENKIRKKTEQEKQRYLEELARNKVIYLVIKLRKKKIVGTHLYTQEETDFFGEGMLDTMLKDTINKSHEFKGRVDNEHTFEKDTHNIIFYDITDAIDYAFYAHNKVNEINRDVISKGEKLYYAIGCHCSYSESTANKDFQVTYKVLNLGSESEILVTDLFKRKYKALKEETNIAFNSKGVYIVDNEEVEIFQIQPR